jgi:hypothetical protein
MTWMWAEAKIQCSKDHKIEDTVHLRWKGHLIWTTTLHQFSYFCSSSWERSKWAWHRLPNSASNIYTSGREAPSIIVQELYISSTIITRITHNIKDTMKNYYSPFEETFYAPLYSNITFFFQILIFLRFCDNISQLHKTDKHKKDFQKSHASLICLIMP